MTVEFNDLESFMEIASEAKLLAVKPPLLSPPTKPSVFAIQVKSDLKRVLANLEEPILTQEADLVTSYFEQTPLLGLAYLFGEIPKKSFSKTPNLEVWINLLVTLIDHYAALTHRTQIKNTYWRSKCLKGMLRKLSRMPSKSLDCYVDWNEFTSGLLKEALPDTRSPLTKAYFQRGNKDLENFRKLAVFTRTGKNVWKANYSFPLSIIRNLDEDNLLLLLSSEIAHLRRIGLSALRMDLLEQHQEYILDIKKHFPARNTLNRLIRDLGDMDLAKLADNALGPLEPLENSFEKLLKLKERDRKAVNRRPNAKRRYIK